MNRKCAVFDMDGTLLDSMPAWRDLVPKMLRQLNCPFTADIQKRLKFMTAIEGALYYKKTWGLPWSEERIRNWQREEMLSYYQVSAQAKPFVKEFLEQLYQNGTAVCIATATERPLAESALRCAGIWQYVHSLTTVPEVKEEKSRGPAVFEAAMESTFAQKADTIVFEDTLHAIQTAKQAGFRVVAVYDRTAEPYEAEIRKISDLYVESFEELIQRNEKGTLFSI